MEVELSTPQGSVFLAGGLSVPLRALQLAWDLEDRGCRLVLDGDGLAVGPRELLTDADRAAIRRWRDDLRMVVEHCESLPRL